MKVYKFRSTNQIEFLFDIILNKRLYCADWESLNDPMEGVLKPPHEFYERFQDYSWEAIKDLNSEAKSIKICSLSKTIDSILMWSHYADGFNGFAIEIELPDDDPSIKDVQYREESHYTPTPNESINSYVINSFTSKTKEWKHEQEVRIIQRGIWFDYNVSVNAIIAGLRVSKTLYDTLKIICSNQEISLFKSSIDDGRVNIIHE